MVQEAIDMGGAIMNQWMCTYGMEWNTSLHDIGMDQAL